MGTNISEDKPSKPLVKYIYLKLLFIAFFFFSFFPLSSYEFIFILGYSLQTILRIDEDFLSSKRQEYLEAVFRDRMRPPTMTLEELLEIEREKAEQQSKLAE